MNRQSTNPETSPSLLFRLRDPANEQDWDVFVKRYLPAIIRWAKLQGLQDADARDVAQSVLQRLFLKIPNFRYEGTKGSFRGWLKTIVQNMANDVHREAKKQQQLRQDPLYRMLVEDRNAQDSLSQILQDEYVQEILRHAETRAKERVSEVIWQTYYLTYHCHMKVGEAGQALGIHGNFVSVYRGRVVQIIVQEVKRIAPDLFGEIDTK